MLSRRSLSMSFDFRFLPGVSNLDRENHRVRVPFSRTHNKAALLEITPTSDSEFLAIASFPDQQSTFQVATYHLFS